MIKRNLSKYTYVHEHNKEASFVASQGINITKAPTIREYIQDINNLDVAENGSLTLRKPITAEAYGEGTPLGWNFDNTCYFYIDNGRLNSPNRTIYVKYMDRDSKENITVSLTDVTSDLDFTDSELINTATSSFITNVVVGNPIVTQSVTGNIVDITGDVYRILKIVEWDNSSVTLEIYTPETSYLDSSLEAVINANLNSDDAYNITDSYNSAAISIEGILAYGYAHHPTSADPKPISANITYEDTMHLMNESTVADIFETLQSTKFTPYTSTVPSNKVVVLKAFMNIGNTKIKNMYDENNPLTPYFCTWEYSSDGIVWETVPEFKDDSKYSSELKAFKAKVIDPTKSDETLETSTTWYREILARKFIPTSNTDPVNSRADILVLHNADEYQYRFTIYKMNDYVVYNKPDLKSRQYVATGVNDAGGNPIRAYYPTAATQPVSYDAEDSIDTELSIRVPVYIGPIFTPETISYHQGVGDLTDIIENHKLEITSAYFTKRVITTQDDDHFISDTTAVEYLDDYPKVLTINDLSEANIDVHFNGTAAEIIPCTTLHLNIKLSVKNSDDEYEELYSFHRSIFVYPRNTAHAGNYYFLERMEKPGFEDYAKILIKDLPSLYIYNSLLNYVSTYEDEEEETHPYVRYVEREEYVGGDRIGSEYYTSTEYVSYTNISTAGVADTDNIYRVSDSIIDEQSFTAFVDNLSEFLYTKHSFYSNGNNVARHIYYKYKLYTYGSEVLKNNILVSDADSFTTPIMNTIDLYTTGDSKVTALTPWRDYFIAATDKSIHLMIAQDTGFLTKTVNTYIGIPEADSDTLKSILNGIIFKSGNKIYTLNPNAYSSDDTLLSLTEISKPVAPYILTDAVKSFAFATSDAYYLFMTRANDDSTYVIKYEFTRMIWNRYTLPKRFISYTLDNIENIKLYDISGCSYKFNATYNVDIPNNVKYGDLLYDSDGNTYIQPFTFSLDSGEKTTTLSITKQYVETKLIVGVANEPDIFPLDVNIYVDGLPALYKHIDCSSDHSMIQDTYSPPYPTQSINLVNTHIDSDSSYIVGTLRQEFLRYSLKGKTIRHIISGESYSNFNLFVVYYKYKESHVKQ